MDLLDPLDHKVPVENVVRQEKLVTKETEEIQVQQEPLEPMADLGRLVQEVQLVKLVILVTLEELELRVLLGHQDQRVSKVNKVKQDPEVLLDLRAVQGHPVL